MSCKICGGESGKYSLCFKCNKLKDEGKVVKCEKCGEWHYTNTPCSCTAKKEDTSIIGMIKSAFSLNTDKKNENTKLEKKENIKQEKSNTYTKGDGKCIICGKDAPKGSLCLECYKKKENTEQEKNDTNTKGDGKCIICGKDAPKGYLCLECYKKKEITKKELDYLADIDDTKDYYNNLKYNVFKLRKMDYAQNACIKIFALAEMLEVNFKCKGYIIKGATAIKDLLLKKKEFLAGTKKSEKADEDNEVSGTLEVKEDFKNILNADVKDYRKIYPMNLHCTDGHYVRSKAEREIDNYFFNDNLVHVYEQKYRAVNGQEYYPDFYIPSLKLFIEYFGNDDEEYLGKAAKKIEIYKKDDQYSFVYLTPANDNIIEDKLEEIIWKRRQELKNK